MVEFNFLEKISLRDRNRLKDFLVKMARSEGYRLNSLSVVFCSDDYLLEVNRTYLRHDYFTDIITFDYAGEKGAVEGELFISAHRVKENAKTFGVTVEKELHRVIFHGLLHLCGYRDKSKKDIALMREREEFYLHKYFPRST